MHWLNDRLEILHRLLERQHEYEQLAKKKVTGADEGRKQTRDDFLAEIKDVVKAIAKKDGVIAAFSCHEGLLIEQAGHARNFEALAAVGQRLVYNGRSASKNLRYGPLMQMVVVGESTKLAIFVMGEVEIGVEAGRDVNLTKSLGQAEP